jgi:hypothetical protein
MTRVRRGIGRAELAALVCSTLAVLDDEPVLVGGSVVSLYTDGRWVSDDLDFVTWRRERQYRALLEALGFRKRGSFWEHPSTELLLQFVNPPVMVGNKHVREPARMRARGGSFAGLSPLDCVLDRFAWYLDRGDAQSLEQAADVAAAKQVSLDEVAGWLDAQQWPAQRRKSALDELRRKVKMRRK